MILGLNTHFLVQQNHRVDSQFHDFFFCLAPSPWVGLVVLLSCSNGFIYYCLELRMTNLGKLSLE